MAQSRGALSRQADRLCERGQQLQEGLNILKHEFEMILEQRNYYSNQTEYFGSVVRRLDENSTRYHRRGAQLVEAYEQKQRATDELMRNAHLLGYWGQAEGDGNHPLQGEGNPEPGGPVRQLLEKRETLVYETIYIYTH